MSLPTTAYSVKDKKQVKIKSPVVVKYVTGKRITYMVQGKDKDGNKLSRIIKEEVALAHGDVKTRKPKEKAVVKHRLEHVRCKRAGKLAIKACEERAIERFERGALRALKALEEKPVKVKKPKAKKAKAKKAKK
jgi:hypothetical protein